MPHPEEATPKVSIRPGVGILSVLRHLNYKPWFALAEFIDNSIESYVQHIKELKKVDGGDGSLKVKIELESSNEGTLIIRDNAAGIHQEDYQRAFRPAQLPVDTTGLSEFGMGMKSAACWFSPKWHVRTTALGEATEKIVRFDIEKIVRDELEELSVSTRPANEIHHYTEIVLTNLFTFPQTKTLTKMKEHLTDIYRIFIREGVLGLNFDTISLAHSHPEILVAPPKWDEARPSITWKKEFEFDFGLNLRAHGFAAIRETASVKKAGFALFRRKRLIQGSGDETYRPFRIFGHSNSYRFQRVFGEVHLEGFNVSHTKDGFQWDDCEDTFLDVLRDELEKDPMPILRQAEAFRKKESTTELRSAAASASRRTAEVIEKQVPPILENQITAKPDAEPLPESLPQKICASTRTIEAELGGQPWQIIIDLSDDPSIGDWVTISDSPPVRSGQGDTEPRIVKLRLALLHPFMMQFAGADAAQIEPLLRVAAAIGLGEVAARDSGVKYAGVIRKNVNDLLRNSLSKP